MAVLVLNNLQHYGSLIHILKACFLKSGDIQIYLIVKTFYTKFCHTKKGTLINDIVHSVFIDVHMISMASTGQATSILKTYSGQY